MKWYIDRIPELDATTPLLSVCGDDCAVCPRYIARSDEELHETAVFWHKVGWRDRVVAPEEIRCAGCGTRGKCVFMILPCQKEKAVESCRECQEYCCGKFTTMLAQSDIKEAQCLKACENAELFRLLKRAFYEKRKNLGVEDGTDAAQD